MNKMKILHIGQMIGGLDVYIRNSIIYNRKVMSISLPVVRMISISLLSEMV